MLFSNNINLLLHKSIFDRALWLLFLSFNVHVEVDFTVSLILVLWTAWFMFCLILVLWRSLFIKRWISSRSWRSFFSNNCNLRSCSNRSLSLSNRSLGNTNSLWIRISISSCWFTLRNRNFFSIYRKSGTGRWSFLQNRLSFHWWFLPQSLFDIIFWIRNCCWSLSLATWWWLFIVPIILRTGNWLRWRWRINWLGCYLNSNDTNWLRNSRLPKTVFVVDCPNRIA